MFWGQDTTGSGQYTVELLRALLALGSDDRFLLARPKQRPRGGNEALPVAWETRVAPFELPTPLDRLGENWAKLAFEQVAFPRFCAREEVDVAHVPYWAPPLTCGVPVVVTIHDLIPLLLPAYRGNIQVRAYAHLVSAGARRARWVVTDSEASRRDIIRLLHIPPERVQVVYLAAGDTFRPVTDADSLSAVRQKYALPAHYVLYLGGFDVRKDVPLLLRAYARLAQSWPETPPLVLAGRLPEADTGFFPHPQRHIERVGLVDRVACIGWVSEADKPALYSAADLFVFPSQYEGFGLPVLESLSCGVPAVSTDGGSLPEILGQGGLLAPVGDVDALADAMRRILQNADLRDTLGRQGLEHAARFNWASTARQMAAVYARTRTRAGGSSTPGGRSNCAS
jgi:glycosyltransferase involved in cell wall biosynthesis